MSEALPDLYDEAVLRASNAEPRSAWGLRSDLHAWRPGRILPSEQASLLQLECLGIHRGVKVLECGAGVGWMSSLLLTLGARLCATEPDAKALHDLARRMPENSPLCRAHPLNGWLEAAPFDRICPTEILTTDPSTLRTQLAPEGRLVYWMFCSGALELRLEVLTVTGIVRERLALVRLEGGSEELVAFTGA